MIISKINSTVISGAGRKNIKYGNFFKNLIFYLKIPGFLEIH